MLGYQGLTMVFGSPLVLGGVLRAVTSTAPSGQFGLYAYGGDISGAQVFYSNDVAYIGDQQQMNDEEAADVLFTTGPDNALVGNPDAGATGRTAVPTWSNRMIFVPTATSASRRVGFTGDVTAEPDVDTSGFVFYGATALHQGGVEDDGGAYDNTLYGLWTAVPTQLDRVWSLQWNVTNGNDDGYVAVTLRTTPPAHPFALV
ncbi:hypothetical protein F4777DRAFT_581161 [Nemania sp. FL0916]|nr:hypothetical protein F4777DRAFT_581161 [Nemania sp. FL0916]